MLALQRQLLLFLHAANHIYILDVVQKKVSLNFQFFFLLHRLFIMYSVVYYVQCQDAKWFKD